MSAALRRYRAKACRINRPHFSKRTALATFCLFACLYPATIALRGCLPYPDITPIEYGYKVINTYPHDSAAFTEGLSYHYGRLYESTGLEGKSTIREVDIKTGGILREKPLPGRLFGEGLAFCGDKIVQVTYRAQIGLVYDPINLGILQRFHYDGEGWGLTCGAAQLLLSDGTPRIRFLNPVTFHVVRTLVVIADGKPLWNINELEWINGEIYANVWMSDYVVEINPRNGTVEGWINLRNLLPPKDRVLGVSAELNGIAYDAVGNRLFVTGKGWPKLFEIQPLKLGARKLPV